LDYAVKTMSESMKGQVYADGVQTELTSHYHNVAMSNFVVFNEICNRANKPLPEFYTKTIEQMYGYIAHAVRPDGYRILNNDGDRGSDRALILRGAHKYRRPDWEYIATNGKSGTKPQDGSSYFYPWAGQLISRSDFGKDAHWSFFDIGPWGSGHQHNDKLHISISAYGRDLLVDAGRFAYTGEVARKYRGYAKGTQGHNAVLIDGKGQMPSVRVTDKPLTGNHYRVTPEFDYAWNSFEKYYGIKNVRHTRSLMYVRGEFWVIVDSVETKKPRTIETLWHWHPTCRVDIKKGSVIATKNEKGNLMIVPIEKADWKVNVIKGQKEPDIQGWYSEEYNKFEPNLAVIHSTRIEGNARFIWLLIPSEKETAGLKAEIISKAPDQLRLMVTNKQTRTWKLTIPYANSQKAELEFSDKNP